MYEVLQFVEETRGADPTRKVIASSEQMDEALVLARTAWHSFQSADAGAYAWWTVQDPASQYASWLADNRSQKEFIVDLRTGELIELP